MGLRGGEEGSDAVGAADAVGGVGMGAESLGAEAVGRVHSLEGDAQLLLQDFGHGMEHGDTSFAFFPISIAWNPLDCKMFFQTDGKNLTAEILSVFEGKKRFILLTKLFSCAIMKIVDFTTMLPLNTS
jgi:hypothetical protein